MEITDKYKGLFIELKTPTLKGVISPEQENIIDQLKIRGYKCLIIDDYDDAMSWGDPHVPSGRDL